MDLKFIDICSFQIVREHKIDDLTFCLADQSFCVQGGALRVNVHTTVKPIEISIFGGNDVRLLFTSAEGAIEFSDKLVDALLEARRKNNSMLD